MGAILSPVSWQRMSDAVENVRRRSLRAARVLEGAGVPYAVVGGNAVAAWVSRVEESERPPSSSVIRPNTVIPSSPGNAPPTAETSAPR